jgi:hypothetical protein
MILPPRKRGQASLSLRGQGGLSPFSQGREASAWTERSVPLCTTPPTRLFLGLDLGLRHDHSTLALIERAALPTGEFDHARWQPVTRLALTLRALRRWPLGTPYLDVTSDVSVILKQHHQPTLALDASGPGAPIFEMLRAARTRARIQPVLVTSGARASQASDSTLLVPRDQLLSQLRILFEINRIEIAPGLPHTTRLRDELASLGQPRSNAHDDLVIALALAAHLAIANSPALRRPS